MRRLRSLRRRKTGLDVDLNVLPPSESRDEVGSSAPQGVPEAPPAPIDVEAFDDDVIISSPRAFAEAKNNSRRNRGQAVVVDVDSEEPSRIPPITRSKRRRGSMNQTLNCGLFINLEASSNSMKDSAKCDLPPPPPPKELTFNCPVCMGPLVEEVSTKCGHIFCKACIKVAIAAQSKCPTCRRRVTAKDIIRIYLPAASSCS